MQIVPKNAGNAVGLDVYAGPRRRGNPVSDFRDPETLLVRTFGVASDDTRRELSGVPCALDAGVYSAQFNTPANVILPDYGPIRARAERAMTMVSGCEVKEVEAQDHTVAC